jgi:hypothetical protein
MRMDAMVMQLHWFCNISINAVLTR